MDPGAAFLTAAASGDLDGVRALLKDLKDKNLDSSGCREEQSGRNALMLAAIHGHIGIVRELLASGLPWNDMDAQMKTAGEYARDGGHMDVYEELVNAGCRAELLLGLLGRKRTSLPATTPKPANADYLTQPLVYKEGKLLSAEGDGVMMGWEQPLMEHHARFLCCRDGDPSRPYNADVLNIGFGLGLFDMEVQKHSPRSHTIVEAHPDVIKHMREKGWDKKPGITIVEGRWQDVLPQLGQYDAIFFDTFGEYYDDMREFHEALPNLLRQEGRYSFFNGLCGTNVFFQEVTRTVAEMELRSMALRTQFHPIRVDWFRGGGVDWEGVKRMYWSLDEYFLPVCVFDTSLL